MSDSLVYYSEMSLAATYAMRRPLLARVAARLALISAIRMRRPDLAYRANAMLGAI
jgi:hypothetical protein